MPYLVGVDTGGTFTDCVAVDERGRVHIGKAPSTPGNFAQGIVDSLDVVASGLGLSLAGLLNETSLFAHGSTVATNAMINRSGARAGLITTRGFEDTLLIMRGIGRVAGLDEQEVTRMARTSKPEPIIPKTLIRGVRERVDSTGAILTPLDIEDARRAVDALIEAYVESIAICLLWSFRDATHELAIKRMIAEKYPHVFVSTSSDLIPMMGEYERTATTALNAYLGPSVQKYLSSLDDDLRSLGLARSPLIMQAYGGCLPIQEAIKQPITTISSGPVGGLVGSKFLAEMLGHRNVITTDVGGTSFDVGLIYDGQIERARESVIAQYHLLTPMLEIASIGAGGGSVAWIEPVTGLLRVGPRSAGARPGPVCYDLGGEEPTVTDADLVLGFLNPEHFLGGRMRLDINKARTAIGDRIARPMGMEIVEAAAAVYDIVNAHMSDLIRKVTIERGYDPRTCVLFVYGGAGPVHAGAYGADLGVQSIVVPPTAAVHSAMGIAAADIVHIYELSDPLPMPADVERLNANLHRLEKRAWADLASEGFAREATEIRRYFDLRYRRQVHEIVVPVRSGELTSADVERLADDFERIYEVSYGRGSAYREAGIEIVTFRVEAVGKTPKPILSRREETSEDPSPAWKFSRQVYSRSLGGYVQAEVFDFDRLCPGNVLRGPAIVETPVTTVVIHSGQVGRADEYINIVIKA